MSSTRVSGKHHPCKEGAGTQMRTCSLSPCPGLSVPPLWPNSELGTRRQGILGERMINKPSATALKVTKTYIAGQRGNPLPLCLGTSWQEAKVLGYSTWGLSPRKSNIWIKQGQNPLKREREKTLLFHLLSLLTRVPKRGREPIPMVRTGSRAESTQCKNLETGDGHVCLYFAPGTGRPLNVSSARSACFPHVPTVCKGKKKKENGIFRSMHHKALLGTVFSSLALS